ncbi:TIGR02677 family protein [Algiphilus sp. NNCM1]|uniref:TIGR02677 family protein n=1 Tax=Algiphilus sp. TaxID=1872431 RepID=UPI001CA7143B|nr:TIGR02677 family protein [Algiphilus sp.]MBY8965956.1 TIGR02677 family protein [Algiphilus acroporae]MCI5062395.1 TIGR02677 family protein [Algiphilus sp.]MCI5102321.1 TIGR02677 family protein [Algiphilus sp.]
MEESGSSRRATLFRHVSAEKSPLYRAVMECFAAANRQFRLHLRPDEVHAEADWPEAAPELEEVQQLLSQLVEWGNLQSQPDTARVQTLEDFYRARFLYRLSHAGEAVESGLAAYEQMLQRRGELQSVALEDIASRLDALDRLNGSEAPDAAKVHETLRDLTHVLTSLAESAQAFMSDMSRATDLQQGEVAVVMRYKSRLVEYLERFIGDLVSRTGRIAEQLLRLDADIERLLALAAQREARDSTPDDAADDATAPRLAAWRERWQGLLRWFVSVDGEPSQAERLRSAARSAITQLLSAVATLNERRAGKSDRARDFRMLGTWFAQCADDAEAHRLFRVAYALSPCRHLSLINGQETEPATSWLDAPAIPIHPRLRERGRVETRGTPPRMRDRSRERALLARQLAEEEARLDTARKRLATGKPQRLSDIGPLSEAELKILLSVLGELLAEQRHPDHKVTRASTDGTLDLTLEPLATSLRARIESELGTLHGREHRITITAVDAQ